MSETDRSRELEPAASDQVAELYWLVHTGLSLVNRNDTVGGDFSYFTASRTYADDTYDGYIQGDLVNPLAEFNTTGCIAIIGTGELAEKTSITTLEQTRELPHFITGFYLFHQDTRLEIRKHTTLGKPIDIDVRKEAEKFEDGSLENDFDLGTVSRREISELIKQVKQALGLEKTAELTFKTFVKQHVLGWLGKAGIGHFKRDR